MKTTGLKNYNYLTEYYRLLVDIEDNIVDTKRMYGIGCKIVHVYADKIQNQTKIFNYKMKLKYNRKKMSTPLLFFLPKSYKATI